MAEPKSKTTKLPLSRSFLLRLALRAAERNYLRFAAALDEAVDVPFLDAKAEAALFAELTRTSLVGLGNLLDGKPLTHEIATSKRAVAAKACEFLHDHIDELLLEPDTAKLLPDSTGMFDTVVLPGLPGMDRLSSATRKALVSHVRTSIKGDVLPWVLENHLLN